MSRWCSSGRSATAAYSASAPIPGKLDKVTLEGLLRRRRGRPRLLWRLLQVLLLLHPFLSTLGWVPGTRG